MQPDTNYDFIMNPQQPPRRSPLSGNTSLPIKILVITGIVFVVMILLAVVLHAVGGGKGANKAELVSVAQDQTEIARLADSGVENGVSQATKNFAVNIKLVSASQQTDLLNYMAGKGVKPKPKELSLKASANTDTELTSAKSASTFDETYKSVMTSELKTYQSDLNAAYGDADPLGQKVLKEYFNATQLLLTQLSQM